MNVVPPLVDVLIPIYGQPGFVLSLLQSLQHQPRMGDIILVDDCSENAVYEILKRQVEKMHDESGWHEVRLYRNDENKGFTLTVNRGMKKCNNPYALILNSDTQAQPKAIEYMARNLDDGADVCGALLVFLPGSQYAGHVQHAGIGFNPDGIPYHPFMYLHPGHPAVQTWRRVNAVTGAAMMVKRDVWDKLGGFDKHYAPGAYEDVDYSLMVKKVGGTIVYENKAVFGHFQHGSQTPANNFFAQPNLDKNLSYLITKHGRQVTDDEIFYRVSGRG